MTRISLFTSASLTALALAAPVAADVTADDIWQDWTAYMSSFGYEMSGTETRSGNTLSVTDVKMAFDLSNEEAPVGDMVLSMPALLLTENGDGTVSIAIPGVSEMVFESAEGAPEAVRAVISYEQPGFGMKASGDLNNITYTYSADGLRIALKEVTVEGETLPPEAMKFEVETGAITGETVLRKGDLRSYDQRFTSEELKAVFDFASPDGEETGKINFTAGGLSFTGVSTVPEGGIEDFAKALRDGFAGDGRFVLSDTASNMAFTGLEAFTLNSKAASTDYRIAIGAENGLVYDIRQAGAAFNMLISEMPIPISAEMGSVALKVGMPLVKADDPQNYGFTMELNEVTIAETLWGLFDPTQQLPRDPATIQLSIDGAVRLLFDFLDPVQQEAITASDAVPAELHSVNLSNLAIRAAGAALTGNGAFTITPGISPTFGPLGTPEGKVDLALLGGHGLMDKLVAMGLLPEEQAMGARMMMGLFARPGEGGDSLVSTIEINAEGHILANGQRIQ